MLLVHEASLLVTYLKITGRVFWLFFLCIERVLEAQYKQRGQTIDLVFFIPAQPTHTHIYKKNKSLSFLAEVIPLNVSFMSFQQPAMHPPTVTFITWQQKMSFSVKVHFFMMKNGYMRGTKERSNHPCIMSFLHHTRRLNLDNLCF